MNQPFKLILNLTKGYKSEDGRLFVEGIASGTDLDLTGERMSPEAIKSMCRGVLGSELHYQAMVYHCLRAHGGVPARQLGMNVRMWIGDCQTPLFRQRDLRKNPAFHGGYEPVPDVVVFAPAIAGDWRRRNHAATLRNMLLAIEIKASERDKGRLGLAEMQGDIAKLHAHREEVQHLGGDMVPAIMIIDTAPLEAERMQPATLTLALDAAQAHAVHFYYLSQAEVRAWQAPSQAANPQVTASLMNIPG